MNEGRAALLRVLRRTRVEYVARRCSVSRSPVYNWLSGRRTPSKRNRISLRVNYRIPLNAWEIR